jgi:hypothetical protein
MAEFHLLKEKEILDCKDGMKRINETQLPQVAGRHSRVGKTREKGGKNGSSGSQTGNRKEESGVM